MSTEGKEELIALIRSGWRLIALESFEEDRALGLLEQVASACERACIPWSLASGIEGRPQSSGSLDAGLRAIGANEAPALFALLDAHRLLDEDDEPSREDRVLPTPGGLPGHVDDLHGRQPAAADPLAEGEQRELPGPGVPPALEGRRGRAENDRRAGVPGPDDSGVPGVVPGRRLLLERPLVLLVHDD